MYATAVAALSLLHMDVIHSSKNPYITSRLYLPTICKRVCVLSYYSLLFFVEVNTCDYRELGKYVLILFGKSVQFCSNVNELKI